MMVNAPFTTMARFCNFHGRHGYAEAGGVERAAGAGNPGQPVVMSAEG
jgi:hypothetical protein